MRGLCNALVSNSSTKWRKTRASLFLAMLCALSVAIPGPLFAQEEPQRRGIERFRMVSYPDRFPLAEGPADNSLEGSRRNLTVSVDLLGEWGDQPPTLRIHHQSSVIGRVKDGEDRIIAGPVEVDPADGHGSLSVGMVQGSADGDYFKAYAILEHRGDTWRTDPISIEWKDEKPIADFTEFLSQSPGGGDFVALFVPLVLAGGLLWFTKNAIVAAVGFYAGFAIAYLFLDVTGLLAIIIGASALGAVALAITFRVAQRG